MVIISQSEKEIVNFEQVATIIFDEMDNDIWKIKAYYISGKNTPLGKYKTEKRAKEVLKEIVYKYTEYASVQNKFGDPLSIAIIPRVYEMPKE